jgi:hypothetical protein
VWQRTSRRRSTSYTSAAVSVPCSFCPSSISASSVSHDCAQTHAQARCGLARHTATSSPSSNDANLAGLHERLRTPAVASAVARRDPAGNTSHTCHAHGGVRTQLGRVQSHSLNAPVRLTHRSATPQLSRNVESCT